MIKLESLKKSNHFKLALREKKVHSDFFSIFAAKNFIPVKNKKLLLISFIMKKKYYSFLLVLLAYIVGFSRIYLSQHFLIDVLAGALVGSTVPLLIHSYIEPLIFNKVKD